MRRRAPEPVERPNRQQVAGSCKGRKASGMWCGYALARALTPLLAIAISQAVTGFGMVNAMSVKGVTACPG